MKVVGTFAVSSAYFTLKQTIIKTSYLKVFLKIGAVKIYKKFLKRNSESVHCSAKLQAGGCKSLKMNSFSGIFQGLLLNFKQFLLPFENSQSTFWQHTCCIIVIVCEWDWIYLQMVCSASYWHSNPLDHIQIVDLFYSGDSKFLISQIYLKSDSHFPRKFGLFALMKALLKR